MAAAVDDTQGWEVLKLLADTITDYLLERTKLKCSWFVFKAGHSAVRVMPSSCETRSLSSKD